MGGNIQLHLIQGAHAHIEAAHTTDPRAGVNKAAVPNHIAFETDDFDLTRFRLEAIGREFTYMEVKAAGKVMRQMFLPDPDGHYIEICDCQHLTDFMYTNLRLA